MTWMDAFDFIWMGAFIVIGIITLGWMSGEIQSLTQENDEQ